MKINCENLKRLRKQCEKLRTWRYILRRMRSRATSGQWLLRTIIPHEIGEDFMDEMAERLKSKGFEVAVSPNYKGKYYILSVSWEA